jgi:Leucine-rich repeat (LRR) protein
MIRTHEGRATLDLSEIQPYPDQDEYETKGAGEMRLTVLPDALFDEIPKLRAQHPFDGVVVKSSLLETLPQRFAEFSPWLRALTLQFNEHMASVPALVFGFTDLESLSVHSRRLAEIPADIGALKNLTKLEWTHAKKLTALPAELFGLEPLRVLNLRETGITALPRDIGQLRALEELNLMDTPLTELPREVGELKHLTKLLIRWSKIDPEQAKAIVGPDVMLEA